MELNFDIHISVKCPMVKRTLTNSTTTAVSPLVTYRCINKLYSAVIATIIQMQSNTNILKLLITIIDIFE